MLAILGEFERDLFIPKASLKDALAFVFGEAEKWF